MAEVYMEFSRNGRVMLGIVNRWTPPSTCYKQQKVRPEEELLKPALELLDQLRADASAWSRLRFEPQDHKEHGRHDLNASSRLQLAWALQHAFCSSDEPLLRFALQEEVLWREQDPWQGIGETLEILGAITACRRDVQDVWMLARAKQANFDTGCGFDLYHLFAAGVAQTIAYVQAGDRSEREEVLKLLLDEQGEPRCDDLEVNAWLESRPDQLPLDKGSRSKIWFERALAAGRRDLASQLLDERIKQEAGDASARHSYVYDLESLERWTEASELRKERFALVDDAFDKAGEARDIARLERLAQRPGEAERWLRIAAKLHADHEDWRQIGLGRMFVEECFRVAIALGTQAGGEMFSMGDEFAQSTPRLPLVALEAAVEAAGIFQSARLSYYKQKQEREARRIENLGGGSKD